MVQSRLQIDYDDGTNWIPFTTGANSLTLSLEIDENIYQPSVARFKIADLKDNGPFAASSTNSVLKEFMRIRIVDPSTHIVYFHGKIYRLTNGYQEPYGEIIEGVAYDALYNLANEYLGEAADSVSSSTASNLISTWVGNHINTSLLSTANDGGDVARFETSGVNRAVTSKPVKEGRSQTSVLGSIVKEALQDKRKTTLDQGYVFYSDPNFTDTATTHFPAQFLTYFARDRMPAVASHTSDATPSANGLTIEKPDGTSITATGTKHIMMTNLELSNSSREVVTDVIANYVHDVSGEQVSKRFSIIHYTAVSSMAAAQYAGIAFDATVGTGGTNISNLVDSGNNVIGRIQYMSGTSSGFMILSDRTSHALVAGETLYADSNASGISMTLSSVDTLGSQNLYEPKAVWGVTKTLKVKFGSEVDHDAIRTKLASVFEGGENVPQRGSFNTWELPYYWAEGQATSGTSGNDLVDSAVNWETKGLRTGAALIQLDGTGGSETAWAYVSGLTTGGTITAALNTGTWSTNDYYKWQVRVRVGHRMYVICVPKGIAGESHVVTRIRIQQNLGSQTITSYETQGVATATSPLAEAGAPALSSDNVDGDNTTPLGKITAKYSGTFVVGAKASPDNTRHNTLSWAAATLRVDGVIAIDGNEKPEYSIAANDTTTIFGGALNADTEYTLYFEPTVSDTEFAIVLSSSYASADRSKIKIGTITTVNSEGGTGDGNESECQFDMNDTTVVMEGGKTQKLGGDYFTSNGIIAKHVLVAGSDATSGTRFKFNTPSSGDTNAWFRGFKDASISDTTGKWFEFDVANERFNLYDGTETAKLLARFDGSSLTFYDGSSATADVSDKLSAFTSTGLFFYDHTANGYLLTRFDGSGMTVFDGTAADTSGRVLVNINKFGILVSQTTGGGADSEVPGLRFTNDNIDEVDAGWIGYWNDTGAQEELHVMGPGTIAGGTAISFGVALRSYGSTIPGSEDDVGTFKVNWGDTTYSDALIQQFSGPDGTDLTISGNFDTHSITSSVIIGGNFDQLIVPDGTDAIPGYTFTNQTNSGFYLFSNTNLTVTNVGATTMFFSSAGNYISAYDDFLPLTTAAALDLGSAAREWQNLFLVVAPTVSSDADLKEFVVDAPLGLDFVNNLHPVSYVLKDVPVPKRNPDEPKGREIEVKKHSRRHYGLTAQDVKQALDIAGVSTDDFAGYVDPKVNDPDSTGHLSLRYSEFIAPMMKAIQELSARVDSLG